MKDSIERALLDADGSLRKVTKIEIEILSGGDCRWNLFNGADRQASIPASPGDVPHMLEAVGLVVGTMVAEALRAQAEAN